MTRREAEQRPIFYVCAASEWQIVNLGPLAALGWNRVKGVALCVGSSGDEAADEVHAQAPARYLQEWVRSTAPEGVRVSVLDGDGSSFRDWYEKIKAWAEPLAALDPIFLVNTTGGMKPMSLGATLGLEEVCAGGAGETELIYYRAKPQPGVETLKGLLPAIEAAQLGLSDYLQIRGWRICNPAERSARETAAVSRRRLTEFFWRECGDDPSGAKSKLLTVLAQRAGRGPLDGTGARRLFTWPEVDQIIDSIGGIGARAKDVLRQFAVNLAGFHPLSGESGIAVPGADRGYLGGKWLEEHVYNRVEDALRPGAEATSEVALGIKIERVVPVRRGSNNFDHEIDVTVYHRNLLHVVSCKSGTGNNRGDRHEIAALKASLAGAFGIAALVLPREREAPDLRRQAREVGVDYLTGSSGLDELCAKVARL